MIVPVHREKAHVLPLDSVRGVAAVTVVIHHIILMPMFLAALPYKAWIDCSFFRSGWLLVDLFFVLSGIVMALSYAETDFGRFSLSDFMVRRLARVYPLHLVMLVALLVFRFVRIGFVAIGVLSSDPAAFEVNNAYSFVLNVFLLHSLGIVDYLSWNGPSWSISVEFYTYLIFGMLLLISERLASIRYFYVCAIGLVLGCWVVVTFALGKSDLQLQTDFGLLRCIASFFLGVLTAKLVSRLPHEINRYTQGAIQMMALGLTLTQVSIAEAYPGTTFVAPLTFAIFLGSLLAFPNAPLVPTLLSTKPLVWLGRRSYSVYMVHAFVVLLAEYFVKALGARPIAALDSVYPGLATSMNLIVVLAAVLILSDFTYRYVEIPGGSFLRRAFGKAPIFSPSTAAPSARPSN